LKRPIAVGRLLRPEFARWLPTRGRSLRRACRQNSSGSSVVAHFHRAASWRHEHVVEGPEGWLCRSLPAVPDVVAAM
jgi:hypothetical protein